MKIAIQGETGCFHEVAARQYFSYDEIIYSMFTFDLELNTLKDAGQILQLWLLKMPVWQYSVQLYSSQGIRNEILET